MNRIVNVGEAARIGTYSDAVVMAPKRVLYVSGTLGGSMPGTGRFPKSSPIRPIWRGGTSRLSWQKRE
jgi:hypothetical protein